MNGLLLLDKPQGMTSHDVVGRVRRALKMRRVGHAGTLDPLATGVLPVAVGFATRILQFVTLADKSYRVTARLGVATDTQDAEGQVVQLMPTTGLTCAAVAESCRQFCGDQLQTPPMYSAVKVDGTPLHRLARRGIEVERAARPVRVDRFELLGCELPDLTLEVDCSKGTYVRTLCHDLGQQLGCGAHVTALRRLRVGCFGVDECLPLAELEARVAGDSVPLLSEDETLGRCGLPAVALSAAAAARVTHGVAPWSSECLELPPLVPDTVVRLRHDDRLLAVARYGGRPDRRGDFQLLRVVAAATSA